MAERIQLNGFDINWDCDVVGAGLSLELAQLTAVVVLFIPGATSDNWKCGLESSGIFTTRAMRAKMVGSNMGFPSNRIGWIKEAPLKVLTFVCRAKMGRIPSSLALNLRGIITVSFTCGNCNMIIECADRIFTSCGFAKTTRK